MNTLTLERAMLARQVATGGPSFSYAEHLLSAPPCPGCDEPEPACICGGIEDDFDIASSKGFVEPLNGEQHGPNLSLYSINVHAKATGELVGKYELVSDDITKNRRIALAAALRDSDYESAADLEAREEWR